MAVELAVCILRPTHTKSTHTMSSKVLIPMVMFLSDITPGDPMSSDWKGVHTRCEAFLSNRLLEQRILLVIDQGSIRDFVSSKLERGE